REFRYSEMVPRSRLLCAVGLQRSEGLWAIERRTRAGGPGAWHEGELPFLHGNRSRVLHEGAATALQCRAAEGIGGPVAARRDREAIRPRSRFRKGAEPAACVCTKGRPDLSHRSLPGQRDGPKYHGAAIRK